MISKIEVNNSELGVLQQELLGWDFMPINRTSLLESRKSHVIILTMQARIGLMESKQPLPMTYVAKLSHHALVETRQIIELIQVLMKSI